MGPHGSRENCAEGAAAATVFASGSRADAEEMNAKRNSAFIADIEVGVHSSHFTATFARQKPSRAPVVAYPLAMSDDTIPALLRRQAAHLTLKPFMQVWQPGEGVVLTLSFAEMLRRVEAAERELLGLGIVNVHTIDSYQGQEADAVILSMVRREDIGFWQDARRLNVALTRAKHCLRIVGATQAWTGILNELKDDAEERGLLESGVE